MSSDISAVADTANQSNNHQHEEPFAPFAEKMLAEGLPQLAVETFRYYYELLLSGETGYISSDVAQPVYELPEASQLSTFRAEGKEALNRTAILRLNGGLGTSMGMTGPKSLLKVKGDLTFLDIIIRQVLHIRQAHQVRLPLVLMNSFNTVVQTEEALRAYPALKQAMPFGFVQNKVPKISKATMAPAKWPDNSEKEWCPPGHGDLYIALATSGVLEQMLDAGYEYIFVSNSDNLGATLDLDILGYFADNDIPFMMEVAHRTEADRKGGHLAEIASNQPNAGQLILREVAQCPPDEIDQFQDTARYRYFNTNNLWIHLPSLQEMLETKNGILGLPLIRNEKTVEPTEPESERVYQLETAMGSAIGIFEGARAISVPRSRFVPIKKNSDLLVLLSDAYNLTNDYRLELAAEQVPLVKLDERYYQQISQLQERFPKGAPSLRNCRTFEVSGDVTFGKDVAIEGDVVVSNEDESPMHIGSGQKLNG